MTRVAVTSAQLPVVLGLMNHERLPFPLEVPAGLTSRVERARIRDDLRNNLVRRDRSRSLVWVRDDVEEAFALLRTPKAMVTVLGQGRDGEIVRAVLVANGSFAVLAEQDEQELRLVTVRRESLAGLAVGVLPYASRGHGPELRYPAAEHGDPEHARAQALLAGRVRTGTITVHAYEHDYTLTWFDCPDGRYVAHTTDGRTTIEPAGTEDVATRLTRQLTVPRDR